MTHVHGTTAALPGVGTTAAAGSTTGTHAHGHLEPKPPRSGDPRFINGTTGEFGQSQTIKQKDGPAYGGEPVEKNQNGNDKKQQNYGVTDANFSRTLGVIPDPDTGQPMSYAQTMQAYNAVGAIQALAPDVYAQLVKNQDAGLGTVQGGALAILGITQSDGQGGASLRGIDQNAIASLRNAQLPGIGSLRSYVLDTNDAKGREWNRAHHSESHWKAMAELTGTKGWSWQDAALFTGDSMTSWSGRVLGSNNQDGNKTGFADDEMAGLKYLVLVEQATGRPNILESVLGSHADTHLPEDKLTNPKINKLIGLPDNFRPTTPEDIAMVAGRIRQWALQPGVEVNRNEFEKFVKNTPADIAGALNASGLLNTVQFEVENNNNNGGGGGGNAENNGNEDVTPTGVGTGELTVDPAAAAEATGAGTGTTQAGTGADALGGGGTTAADQAGAGATAITHVAREILDEVAASPKKLSPADQALMFAMLSDIAESAKNSVVSKKDKESAKKVQAALDAKQGAKVASEALRAAMADGVIDETERASLEGMLGEDGKKMLDEVMKDGTVDEGELAKLKDKAEKAADKADAAAVPEDVQEALKDGKITDEERATLEKSLSKDDLAKLDAAVKDGTVDDKELAKLGAGFAKDAAKEDAAAAKDAAKDDKAAAKDADGKPHPGVEGSSGDVPPGGEKAGAAPAEGTKAESDKPAAGDKPAADTPAAGDKPAADTPAAGDKPAADKPAGDTPAADKPAGDTPAADKPAADKPAEGDKAA